MLAEFFYFLAEMHYYLCYLQFDQMYERTWRMWYEGSETFNPGQWAIWGYYLAEPLSMVMDEFAIVWPDADPWYYVDFMYFSYDIDVIDRAFSRLIYRPVEEMQMDIEQGQYHLFMAQMFEVLAAIFEIF